MATQLLPTRASTESAHLIPSIESPARLPKIILNTVTEVDKRGSRLTAKQHHEHIQVTAYHLAARRGFAPGHEREDWATAENLVIDRCGLAVT
jgi:hypothetical protein